MHLALECTILYFGFGILEFAEGLSKEVPDAHMVWVIDDLTVTGGIKEAAKAYIKEEGPKWGLFLSKKGGRQGCLRAGRNNRS